MLKQTRLSSIFLIVILFGILLIAMFFRVKGSAIISEGHFTSADAYFYYWHAQLISEHGTLPERDMHRWLPIGRDLEQTLNLYVYVLSYTHKALSFLFSSLTLYQVCFYMPVACFCIALCVLSLFLYRTFGPLFSSIVGILLATLPGSIERSAAGFGDRDAFCLMLGLLSVITYLMSLQAETPKKRLIWTFTSGFTVFLGGLSWVYCHRKFRPLSNIRLCDNDDLFERSYPMAKRRRFPAKFKAAVVLEALTGASSQAELCRRYNLSENQVSTWKHQLLENVETFFESPEKHSSELADRIAQLEHLVGRLTLALEIEKKAATLLD